MTRELNDEEMDIYNEMQFEKKRQAELNAHPDCRDPDHPGCAWCNPDLWNPEND